MMTIDKTAAIISGRSISNDDNDEWLDKSRCPICMGKSKHHMDATGWGEMRRCLSCGFVFANPMALEEKPEELYGRAYSGGESNCRMGSFYNRLSFLDALKATHLEPDSEFLLSSGRRQALDLVIMANCAPGSVVFDIGCGNGEFLRILQKHGYRPVGLDVAKPAVQMLQEEGYEVWHGSLETLPPNWVEPQVVTSLFVMHHLPDPMGFLAAIRTRFPKAPLIVGARNILGRGLHYRWLPPRNLSWWGELPLRLAMEKAGYKVNIIVPRAVWSDFPVPGLDGLLAYLARRSLRAFALLLYIHCRVSKLVLWPLVLCYRWQHWNTSVLAIGWPVED